MHGVFFRQSCFYLCNSFIWNESGDLPSSVVHEKMLWVPLAIRDRNTVHVIQTVRIRFFKTSSKWFVLLLQSYEVYVECHPTCHFVMIRYCCWWGPGRERWRVAIEKSDDFHFQCPIQNKLRKCTYRDPISNKVYFLHNFNLSLIDLLDWKLKHQSVISHINNNCHASQMKQLERCFPVVSWDIWPR